MTLDLTPTPVLQELIDDLEIPELLGSEMGEL